MITFCADTAPNLSHVSVKPEDVSLPYQVQKITLGNAIE